MNSENLRLQEIWGKYSKLELNLQSHGAIKSDSVILCCVYR